MPDLLFHQNMRTFSGGKSIRNNAYCGAFSDIQKDLGANTQIDIAGYTEIMNSCASVNALNTLSNTLFGVTGGAQVYVIPCGITALAHGPEYIGIAVRPGLAVKSLGRITFDASGDALLLAHERIPPQPPGAVQWSFPQNMSADYRGLVYVVVAICQTDIAVGFLHNMYTFADQRILERLKISAMLQCMAVAGSPPGSSGASTCYIGGDYNLNPANVGTFHQGYAYPYSAGPTTSGGHTYDYWYSLIDPQGGGAILPVPPFRLPAAGVDRRTIGQDLSDHAAVAMQII